MEIVPRQNFRDARDVWARFTKYDPRLHSFPSPDVIVNLGECSSVQPSAILWCMVYLLSWERSGFDCLLLPPKDRAAVASLTDAGLFPILRERGIDVISDDAGISDSMDTILPITRFDGLGEADELTNRVESGLYNLGLGSSNIRHIVCELFSELACNAAEHSESPIGAYGFIRFSSSQRGRRFECAVADGGIGIRQSIERNPELAHSGVEWSALELAVKELVSGTASSTRGIGLFSIFDEMHTPGRELIIHSGNGILIINKYSEIRIGRANSFPGTLVYLSIPA